MSLGDTISLPLVCLHIYFSFSKLAPAATCVPRALQLAKEQVLAWGCLIISSWRPWPICFPPQLSLFFSFFFLRKKTGHTGEPAIAARTIACDWSIHHGPRSYSWPAWRSRHHHRCLHRGLHFIRIYTLPRLRGKIINTSTNIS